MEVDRGAWAAIYIYISIYIYIHIYIYIYIYKKNSRGTRCSRSGSFAIVFPIARDHASKTAQGSIFLPRWVPKPVQNRFRTPLGSHWQRQLDFTSIEAGFSSLQRSYESLKSIENCRFFKDFACSSLHAFIFN